METISRTKNDKGETAFRTSTGLLVNQGVRSIQSGGQYDHLIDTKSVQFTSTFTEGTVDDTVLMICELIRKHHGQVQALASYLKKDSRIKTMESIWDFVFHHIQYKRDKVGVEQLSTPARIWLNRSTPNTPSDCDDHTVFVGSLLYCLGIPFTIRIAGYEGKAFSHVYVICGDVCIDTVLHRFNCEAKYTSKKDKQMQIETLAGHENDPEFIEGLSALDELHDSGENYDISMQEIDDTEQINGVEDTGLDDEEQALRIMGKTQLGITLREYEKEPETFHALGFGREYWNHMKGAFNALENGASLDGIIIKMNDGAQWERANLSPLNGMSLEGETIGLLGALDGFFKKFRRKLKKAVKSVGKGIKKAAKFVAKGFKKVAKFLMKINPINIAIRALLRLFVKKNLKGLALKMGYGLLTATQAKQLGISTGDYNASKKAYSRFAKKYKFLGGKESKLRKVLSSAWQKAAKKANMPSMNLSGELGQLEGRRRRRKRRKARAKAKKLLANRNKAKKAVNTAKPMSAYEKERLAFLKLVHKDIAKQELGFIASSSAAVAAKAKLIWAAIIKLVKNIALKIGKKIGIKALKKTGKKVLQKVVENRIENLSERITNETDPGKRKRLEQKRDKAENNLVIINRAVDKEETAKPNNSTSNSQTASYSETGSNNAIQPITSQNTKQAGMNPFAIGALILVGGGLLWGTNKKKSNQSKK